MQAREADQLPSDGEKAKEKLDNPLQKKPWKDWHEIDAKAMRMTSMVKEGYPHFITRTNQSYCTSWLVF
jgi:hypothetical protein